MKKVKIRVLLVIMMCFSVFLTFDVANAATVDSVSSSTILSSDYAWSFKFMSGTTTVETNGMTNYDADWTDTRTEDVCYSARLTSNSQKGNIWIRYNNVGTYNGEVIDLKITLMDWDYLQPSTSGNYNTVFFSKTSIKINLTSTPAIAGAVFKCTFYKHGTNTEISVKCHETFVDIDGGEYLQAVSGINTIYIAQDTNLTKSSNKVSATYGVTSEDTDMTNWATLFISGSSFTFKYTRVQDEEGNSYRDVTTASTNRGHYQFSMKAESVAPFEFTTPTKEASVSKVTGTDTFTYTITHYVPGEGSDFYYTSYVLTDSIPECFTIDSVKVTDDAGTNRTSRFSISTSDNKVTATATSSALSSSSFYNNNYNFIITVTKKEGYDMSAWYDLDTCTIPNTASIKISSPTISSTRTETVTTNTTNVDCYFKITTSIDNGSITSGVDEISAGSDKVITFTPQVGYYITSVKVNDVEQTDYTITGDSITLTNISEDQNIVVTTEPMKIIITVDKQDTETQKETQGDAIFTGAEYTIYTDEECENAVETIVTDEEGYATSSELPIVAYENGEYVYYEYYYVKETKAPTGYNIDENVYTVYQNASEQTTATTSHTVVSNEDVIKNDIVIYKYLDKTDSTLKKNLSGAVFSATLNSNSDKVYYSTVTDENGYCIIEDLPYGTYTLVEYTIPPTAFDGQFYVGESGVRVKLISQFIEVDKETSNVYTYSDITDVPKKMNITIYKEDANTGTTTQGDADLAGAKYTLYRDEACTDAIETVIIEKNDDGTYSATSGWYLVGTYYIKENVKEEIDGIKYSYAEGYLVDENVYTVSQEPSEQTEEYKSFSITSKEEVIRGRVDAIKYNDNSTSSDKSPATGAVLRLTLVSDPTVYYDATVDEYGYIEWVEEESREKYYPYTIPYGTYVISEIQASNSGENIFIDKQETEITTQNQSNHYILEDETVTLKLTIEIRDSETEKLVPGGARYKIWNVDNECWYSEMSYPSGEYITEFVTDDNGQLTINGNLEAGTYVIYEITAPEGYYLDDELREGNTGYEFTIAVEKDGNVIACHDGQAETLECQEVMYENVSTTMYYYTAKTYNTPQKVVVSIEKLADQFTSVTTNDSDYGTLNTPVWEEVGLEGVTFNLVAAEDIVTPDGTVRYTQGEVVDIVITDENGLASTIEVYLGEYTLEEVSVPNGYIISEDEKQITIEYTDQYEKVQYLDKEIVTNDTQVTNLSFEKVFEELEVSKFKISDQSAVFGIYTAEVLKNYKGQNTVGKDELVDIMVMDENNQVQSNVNLPEGEYYVKEIDVSNPYILSTDTYEFTVEYTNSTDETIELTISDGQVTNTAKTAELKILIYPDEVYERLQIADITDIDTLEELAKLYGIANKTYGVYEDEECTVPVMTTEDTEATFETDEYGIINIPDMPTGIYYFKELEPAPYGYEISEEIIEVVIDGNTDPVIITASEPLKMAQLLQKTDNFTKDTVADVTYEITDEDENVVYTGQTDEDGYLKIPIIYFENGATYYYQEIDAPDYYELDEEKYEFIASYNEDTCEWTLDLIDVTNDRKTIDYVKVIKTDADTGEKLSGCVFTIVLLDDDGNEYVNESGETIYLVENATTDENGEYIIKNVPYGTYKFVEMVAPEGYELDADMTGLIFTANDDTKDGIIFEVTNTGDIAVIAITGILVLSIIGILTTISRRKKIRNEI